MIVICEPSCKSFSHEKINEGFLYVLNKVNANNDILFLAHKTHWAVLKKSLLKNKVDISRIKFINISVSTNGSFDFIYSLKNIFKLKKISKKFKVEKIVFLSSSKSLIYCLKNILSLNIKKFFVLHAELEELRDEIKLDDQLIEMPNQSNIQKLKKINFKIFKNKINLILKRLDPFQNFINKHVINDLIEKKHDSNFNYLVISEHIYLNLKNKIDLKNLNISHVNYPQLSYDIIAENNNNYPKFAIFGYGDSKMLYNLNLILKNLNIQSPFEIRIIGMDNRGTSSFPWVTFPSNGKTLTRNEMESLLIDIDFNLILYTKDRYSLSCSGSIIEAISYCKPIIHLENPCISFYNKNDSIGFECPDLISIANKIKEIVLNYNQELANIESFKINLEKSRDFLSPDNNLKRFSQVFN
jgi:hypothetical protein